MISQWLFEARNEEEHPVAAPGSPARIAAAIVILTALTLADATPLRELNALEQPRTVPSACGADAVARAQREVDRLRLPSPTAFS